MYRALLIALFTVLTGLRLYYKLIYHALRFKPLSREEGVLPGLVRIFLGIPLLAATVKSCFFPDQAVWMDLPVPGTARVVGFVVGGGAVVLLAFVHRALGANFTTVIERCGPGQGLVTVGPYRYVRHPMYSSYLCFFAGAFLLSANWVLGVCGLGVIGSLMALRVPSEEALLIERYGDAYTAYAQSLPRFFPDGGTLLRRAVGAQRRPGRVGTMPAPQPGERRCAPMQDKTAGLKRIRLVASVIAAFMFAFTAAEQFRAQSPEFLLPGVLLSAVLGFVFLYVIMTIVIHVIRLFRKGD